MCSLIFSFFVGVLVSVVGLLLIINDSAYDTQFYFASKEETLTTVLSTLTYCSMTVVSPTEMISHFYEED